MTRSLFDVRPEWVADTSDDWYTPAWLFTAAGLEFDLDVCSPVDPDRRTCPARRHLTVLEDGLAQDWHGLVWMNPPYSRSALWVAKFAEHPSGLALLPATRSRTTAELLDCSHAVTFFTSQFSRPDGRVDHNPWLLMLTARGAAAVEGLRGIASARGTKWLRTMERRPHNQREKDDAAMSDNGYSVKLDRDSE